MTLFTQRISVRRTIAPWRRHSDRGAVHRPNCACVHASAASCPYASCAVPANGEPSPPTEELFLGLVLVIRGVEVPDNVLARFIDLAVLTYGAVFKLAIVEEALRSLERID